MSSATRPCPADQLEAELALAYARLAGDQHAKAEHVHENAVPLGALGERLGKIACQLVDHARGGHRRGKERRVGPRRGVEQLRRRRHTVGDDHRCGRELEQLLDEAGKRAGLVGADDLDAVGVGEVEVTDQRGGLGCFAPHRGAAFAPGDPGERERLAVVVMQPRDVDLQHPVATP